MSRSVAALATAVLAGCAGNPPEPSTLPVAVLPAPPAVAPAPAPAEAAASGPAQPATDATHYRCDHDIDFKVRFGDGAAQVDVAGRGSDTLLRDAGGTSPQQTVYSSTNLRVEFGLGQDGRGAVLHDAQDALVANCIRD